MAVGGMTDANSGGPVETSHPPATARTHTRVAPVGAAANAVVTNPAVTASKDGLPGGRAAAASRYSRHDRVRRRREARHRGHRQAPGTTVLV